MMSFIYSFEKLQVWHDARVMVKKIYLLTQKFPITERYGLTNQMRRAAVGVVSNIAEGAGRTSPKDQAHFYQMAYSGCFELLNQAIISNDLEFIKESDLVDIRKEIEMISNKLNALRKKSLSSIGRLNA